MKKLCIVLSLILIVGCKPPEDYYYLQLEKLELLKDKILLSESINHSQINTSLDFKRDILPLEIIEDPYSKYPNVSREERGRAMDAYNAFVDAKYLMVMDLLLIYIDDSTDSRVRERILWFLANFRETRSTGFLDIQYEDAKYHSSKIGDKLYLYLDKEMGNYIDIGTTMLFYEKYAKLNGYYYDLSDRDFLATELCRAVGYESLVYASALIDYSLQYFDPGLLRCYGNPIREFKGNTIGIKTSNEVKSKLGVCPQSLRRISGANWGHAASARALDFQNNLKKLGTIDSSKVRSYSDAIDKIQSKLAAASVNTIKISETASSMNALTRKYDKWGACGVCNLESRVECN
jgi:hypothetical protein